MNCGTFKLTQVNQNFNISNKYMKKKKLFKHERHLYCTHNSTTETTLAQLFVISTLV